MTKRILVSCAAAALSFSLPLTAQAPEQIFNTATGQRIKVTQVAGGLVHPYSIMFTDARTLLVAERPGRLRMVRDGVLLPKPVPITISYLDAGSQMKLAALR